MRVPPCRNLIVGFETGDDAAVFRHGDTLLVQTVDVIGPIVGDPETFGRIAALNAVSDVYAMGGRPMTALSVMMYPCAVGSEAAGLMIQGAADELSSCGCVLCGGHTLSGDEVRLGFAVTGVIEGSRIYKNSLLRPKDRLILTKPVGSGIISTAIKAAFASENETRSMTESLLTSNGKASEIMKKYDVSSCTDVTGFGLGGHGMEMARASGADITIHFSEIPLLPGSLEYSKMGLVPAGAYNNLQFAGDGCESRVSKEETSLVFDPQTCGGLLIGVSAKDADALLSELKASGYQAARIIGEAAAGKGRLTVDK